MADVMPRCPNCQRRFPWTQEITDAMVDRAARVMYEMTEARPTHAWERVRDVVREHYLSSARRALAAAFASSAPAPKSTGSYSGMNFITDRDGRSR